MIAHIRASDKEKQSLAEHCRNVSRLCKAYAEKFSVGQLAALIGLLHDMGKATSDFYAYLLDALTDANAVSPHNHAHTGAIFAYRRYFLLSEEGSHRQLTAQIVMLCVQGHHAGLADCWDCTGDSPLLRSLQANEGRAHAAEASAWFVEKVASEAELDALFDAACGEIAALFPDFSDDSTRQVMSAGLLCRLLLSVLVDADRWDAACFEYGENPFSEAAPADWAALLETFEHFRETNLNGTDGINRIRAEISDICNAKATAAPGIFTLTVPTGGGKTYASLRYALRHAQANRLRRIFYIIPYNTILDQNAKDIRDALADYSSILEHHANVVLETEAEQAAHERLTERWDSDIILTSLVQFLNACYAAPNSAARRMHRLTNAVLIFDEIQSLPKHCKVLFERAIRFLAAYGHSTVLLCTATQPRLSLSPAPMELMPDVDALYEQLKRVHYFPQLDARRTYASAGAEIARMLAEQSVLVILNVKAAAWQVYRAAVEALQSRGVQLNRAEEGSSSDGRILCVHLSTRLCPAHRKRLIAQVKQWLRAGRRVLCVSTALIEAGINVSFPVVIRDLAGLPSIVQAAGRANRSMEYGDGRVLIWDFPEEAGALAYLPDVQNGGNITRAFLHDAKICPEGLDSPMLLNKYFLREEAYIKEMRKFPVQVQEGGRTERRFLVHWLALNNAYARMAQENARANQLVLHQSFRTAAQHFFVIADDSIPVLVPWGEGKRIISALGEVRGMQEKIQLIRKAQAYTVQVEARVYQQLAQRNAVVQLGDSGVLALKEGYYSEEEGVATK